MTPRYGSLPARLDVARLTVGAGRGFFAAPIRWRREGYKPAADCRRQDARAFPAVPPRAQTAGAS